MERIGTYDLKTKKGRVLRSYNVVQEHDVLVLYRTTSYDKKDGHATEMDRIVTTCTSMDQLDSFLKPKRKRRKKNRTVQLSIE